MITGAHVMLHSTNDKADMAFLAEVLKLPSINAGHGYMIYAVPPAEMSIHGSEQNDVHKLYLMCDDIAAFTAEMTRHHTPFSTPVRQSWGTATEITLPGGGKLGVYQPRHERPELAHEKQPARKKTDGRGKKAATKKAAETKAKKAAKPSGTRAGKKIKSAKKTAAKKRSSRH